MFKESTKSYKIADNVATATSNTWARYFTPILVACLVNPSGSFQKLQYVSRNLFLIIIRERLSMSRYSLLE